MQIDRKSYYSNYTIIGDISDRKQSNILKVKFNNWEKGCKRPRQAALKQFYSWKQAFQDEAIRLSKVSKLHKNIVKYYHRQKIEETIKGKIDKKYCIFMELCEHDSVAKQMQTVNWHITKKLRISCDIVDVLSVLHSQKWVHRDMKPDNIFLTAKDEVRIGDFDFMKEIRLDSNPHTVGGTPDYMSPFLKFLRKCSIAKDMRINPYKEDVWSTGKTLYEIITYEGRESLMGEYAYNPATILEEEIKVKAKARRKMQDCRLQDEAIEIILSMLTFDTDSRISMEEANLRFKNLPTLNKETQIISDSSSQAAGILDAWAQNSEKGFQKSQNNGQFLSGSLGPFELSSDIPEPEGYQTSEACDDDYQEDEIDTLESTAPDAEENKTLRQENIDSHSQNLFMSSTSLENVSSEIEENRFVSQEGKYFTLESQENLENTFSELENSEILINRSHNYVENYSNEELCELCINELHGCEKCNDVDMISWFIREKIFTGCNYSEITCTWCDSLFSKKIFQCEKMHFGILPDDFFI